MPYVTREQVESKVPEPVLLDALDDDGDGAEEDGLFDSLVATASQEVDGYLSGLFSVPFAEPVPPKVSQAALAFVLESIYGRHNASGEERNPNPYKSQAKFWREHLQKVGNGEIPFDATKGKTFSPGAAITTAPAIDGPSS